MQLVIDISDSLYENILTCWENIHPKVWKILKDGTPLTKGEWVYREELFDDEDKPRMAYGCSKCGHSIKSVHEKGNYCPNCGAKMIEP